MNMANGLPVGTPGFYGWHNRPDEVTRVVATLPFPRASVSATNLIGSGVGKTALLYKAAVQLLGKPLPAQKQPRGTCVSRGWSRAVDYVQCVEIALGGEPEEFKFISHAVVYGLAKEFGNDLGPQNNHRNIRGEYDGDGAVGAWAAKAVTLGCVTNDDVGDVDAGSDDLAIKYAVNGVPADIKAKAKDHPIQAVTQIDGGAEQARDFLANGYPLAVCSNQGFTMTRDSTGGCRPSGTWNHCMMWSAYDADSNRFLAEQSWGQNCPDGPIYLEQPDNSFWIEWNVGDRMLRQGDSFALSKFQGFPGREQLINWAQM